MNQSRLAKQSTSLIFREDTSHNETSVFFIIAKLNQISSSLKFYSSFMNHEQSFSSCNTFPFDTFIFIYF
jgi:hypothetical protein